MKIIESIKSLFSTENRQIEKSNVVTFSEEERRKFRESGDGHYLDWLDYLKGDISFNQLQTKIALAPIQAEEDYRSKRERELREDPNIYPNKFESISHGTYYNICRHCGTHLHRMCALDVCDKCRGK